MNNMILLLNTKSIYCGFKIKRDRTKRQAVESGLGKQSVKRHKERRLRLPCRFQAFTIHRQSKKRRDEQK